MNLYRGQLRRLLELDARIRRGEHPNCASFAREWEVSRKTVQRDLDFLRDALKAPIEYDAVRRGWRYTDRSWRFPALDLTEGELFELAVAGRMAAQYAGTPISATLEGIFEKIRNLLPEPVRVDPVEIDSGFSFHGHPVREVAPDVWTACARAVREGRALRVGYRAFGQRSVRRHVLLPFHLACLAGEWVLAARPLRGGRPFLFALSRMRAAEVAPGPVAREPFDAEAYFSNRFARFVGQDEASHEVVVRFAPSAAEGVLERRWHSRQTVRRERGGGVVLRFPAPALYEVRRWVLQWGGEAEVLEPPELRRAVADEGLRLTRTYRR